MSEKYSVGSMNVKNVIVVPQEFFLFSSHLWVPMNGVEEQILIKNHEREIYEPKNDLEQYEH